MRLYQILVENYDYAVRRAVKDAIVAVKIQGIKELRTQQVLDEFAKQGLPISLEELVNMLSDDPMVSLVNKHVIRFGDEGEDSYANQEVKDENEATVARLAKKALNNRI